MASKSARGTPSATAAVGSELRVELDRLIQKERFKDAVKQAKLCYKQESTLRKPQTLGAGVLPAAPVSSSSSGWRPRRSKLPGISSISA